MTPVPKALELSDVNIVFLKVQKAEEVLLVMRPAPTEVALQWNAQFSRDNVCPVTFMKIPGLNSRANEHCFIISALLFAAPEYA